MLTGIGIIIIIKQIPVFFGYESPEGGFSITEMGGVINVISPGATVIAVFSLGILLLWSNILSKKEKFFSSFKDL